MRKFLRPLVAACAFVLISISVAGAASGPYDPFFATQVTAADFVNANSNERAFGVAAGDFDGDGAADLVVGRVFGNVAFVKGNGDGTFQSPVTFTNWKLETFNAWALAAFDVNGDGNLDLVWGANAAGVDSLAVTRVFDGDIRVLYGNGDGTFQLTSYVRSGVTFNAGELLLRPFTADAGSLAVGDVDGDGDRDLVAGGIDGANSTVKLLRNSGGTFAAETIASQATATSCTSATPCSPIYFPPQANLHTSPWGLAFGDADGDSDLDLWIGDRALYVYSYTNDGTGTFAMQVGNSALASRPNAYLVHESYRAAVGFTESLASGDVNGDGKADLMLGLQSGAQTPASGTAHDGEILMDVSTTGGHTGLGSLADVGTEARGVTLGDLSGDGALDIVAGTYDGKVKVLRQLPPKDTDSDGISDYIDNAPEIANAARLDMNTDGSVNARDQLDNDFDTVLGNPEDQSTWQRLGDPADADDDNDGALDGADNCPFVANAGQADVDSDEIGNACDPLDGRDLDGDGVVTGPLAGDPYFEEAQAAAARWSLGTTHFVIRIDALGRFFQNEFTQILTDAATLTPADWATKCWENYDPGDIPNNSTYEPCGDDATKTLTLPGGEDVPVSLVVIPKQLWTDPPVVTWINDRNDSANLEIGQHGTYHVNNIPFSDWASLADRNFYSCEPCGLTEAENYELMKVGYDTLAGNYGNKWVAESGATPGSPKIDWSSSANPFVSFAAPFNTSDTIARKAIAQLGFKSFSASVFEEQGSYSPIFSPEGTHHEQFDQFGMFHASADAEVDPPDTTGDAFDAAAWHDELVDNTQAGGLNTWLIEEVEWSGRPCNNDPRLGTCGAGDNRENNTVYLPRWNAWLQLLEYVKTYPDSVVMTLGDVALAKAYDNAPTVANAGQADADHDGIGNVIEGASLANPSTTVNRNEASTLTARLTNGADQPLAGQTVTFAFDADGDSTPENYTDTTDASGVAEVSVTPTRPVGLASYSASWDGLRSTATAIWDLYVADATQLALDAGNAAAGQVTDQVTVGATLTDSDDAPLAGQTVSFAVGSATGSGTTDAGGHATANLTLQSPAGATTLTASFAGNGPYGTSGASAAFTVQREDTTLTLPDVVATKKTPAVAAATLTEADGAPLAGRTIVFSVEQKVKGQLVFVDIGTAATDANGVARLDVPPRYVSTARRAIKATFAGDGGFLPTAVTAFAYRA